MSAKKKLWRVFSEYIRLRDAPNGYGSCISCGKMVSYPNSHGGWHAGHYFPRSVVFSGLYFDEKNVNGQCAHCNAFLEGNKEGYRRGLIKKYGADVIDKLELKKVLNRRKMHAFEFDLLAHHYKGLLLEMKDEREATCTRKSGD